MGHAHLRAPARPVPVAPRPMSRPLLTRTHLHRYVVTGPRLPEASDVLRVTDALRRHLLRLGHASGAPLSDAILGHRHDGRADVTVAERHEHAQFSIEPVTDGHGRTCVGGILVVSRLPFSPADLAALRGLLRFATTEVPSCPDDGWGLVRADPAASPLMARSRRWVSATPYVSTKARQDLAGQVATGLAAMTGVRADRIGVSRFRDAGCPGLSHLLDCTRGRKHAYRFGDHGRFEVTFPWDVAGPLTIGTLSHYGLGSFMPA